MDVQHTDEPVNKVRGTLLVEELIKGPLDLYHSPDRVFHFSVDHAACFNVDFENVLDWDPSVLSAVASKDGGLEVLIIIKYILRNFNTIHKYLLSHRLDKVNS